MLEALTEAVGGLPARALARRANVSPQAASGHLRALTVAGLVTPRRHGRHRSYCLSNPDVARVLAALVALAPEVGPTWPSVTLAPPDAAWWCYDHLGGPVAVALADAMVASGWCVFAGREFEVTLLGRRRLREFGLNMLAMPARRRGLALACLDSTEGRHHVAGAIGADVAKELHRRGWLAGAAAGGEVRVTAVGRRGLAETFGATL